ncbi:MAG: bifunctional adenosylcobinamide kinase/adenosylcobinamide-phosphate guanylyltransferase [Pseudomonadota bacterium]
MTQTVLITGGARSGKSAYAEKRVEALGPARIYIATAEAGDAEMVRRIAEHKARRGLGWQSLEEPRDLSGALSGSDTAPRLVDCLTLWLSNLMLAGQDWRAALEGLCRTLAEQKMPVVLVTNEVGAGIVPENALARAFRDAAGRVNQTVAAMADEVVCVIAGQPLTLKRDARARRNRLGQPVGAPMTGWIPPSPPPRQPIEGCFVRLEPLDPTEHAEALFEAFTADVEDRIWTYLPYGPFADVAGLTRWMEAQALGADPLFFAILDRQTGLALGLASYLRIAPQAGSIEVGHINFSPALQRSPLATEAMHLMMARAFALGYRRYEWKCDALNAGSRRAAERLGFRFEGVFRQATHYKGRNRDTAWYAILDHEWPMLDSAFTSWIEAVAADPDRRQRATLAAFVAQARAGLGNELGS